MLRKIKSSYITKVVLFNLKDIKKLKLIKYNKYFQKRINIDILHYKFFSGKYIIYKSKNKGKEYDAYDDYLIYEGEYLKGERNGKGKEYNEYGRKLIYEGEYLKGEKNGKGKEFNYDGKLIFKGEYLNGQRWNGKQYNKEGIIELEIKEGNEEGK